jgi:hypothetical protein
LPDTLKITLNLGDMSVSKLLVSLRAANATSDFTKEFTGITQNTDVTLAVPIASMLSTADISIYPIKLNYLNFYLGTQTAGQGYRLALKDITLCYKNYTVSGISQVQSKGMSIFPNPVNGNQLTIRLDKNITGNLNLNLYAANGQLVYTHNFQNSTKNEYNFRVDNLKTGIYIVKASFDKQQFSSTVYVQ